MAKIAGYQVVEEVARGGQGVVLRVRDRGGAERALKIALSASPADRTLVLAEHQTLSRLDHPALPRVHDVGVLDHAHGDLPAGSPFVVVDWIAGRSIDRVTATDDVGALAHDVATDIAGALAVIHDAGLLHRDVAPGNVVVRDGDGDASRAVLVDLALAEPAGRPGVRGTPAYLAPEALAGAADARSDLYGLGATLWHLATGRSPYSGLTLGDVIQAVLRGDAVPGAPPRVPAPLGDLIARLLARDPAARPQTAIAVLDELAAIGDALSPPARRRPRPRTRAPRRPLPLVGRDAAIAALCRGLATRGAVTRVTSVDGAGADAVFGEAIRRHAIAELAAGRDGAIARGTLAELATRWGAATPAAVIAAARRQPAPVIVDVGDARTLAAVSAAVDPSDRGAALVVHATGVAAPPPLVDIIDVDLGAVDSAAIAAIAGELVGTPPPDGWATTLHARAGGLPAIAADLIRSVDGDPYAVDPATLDTDAAVARARRWLDDQPAEVRALADAIAACGAAPSLDLVIAVAGADLALHIAALRAGGIVDVRGDRVVVAPELVGALVRDLEAGRGIELDERAAAWAEARGDRVTQARHLVGLPMTPARAAVLVAAASDRLPVDPATARELAVVAMSDPATRASAADVAARAALATGDYAAAIADTAAALAAGAPPRVRLIAARAYQRQGALERARDELEQLAAIAPDDDEVSGALARVWIALARPASARDIAGAGGKDHAGALRTEAAGLAAYYLDDLDAADAAFARLDAVAIAAGDGALVGRALALRGMVAQRRGDLVAACDRYDRAARAAREAGELHAAAAAELNLGTALAERGRFADALPVLGVAARRLTALDARADAAAAEFNRGNSLLGLGQLDQAQTAARRARDLAATASPAMVVFADLLDGDIRRRRGDDTGAIAVYRRALAVARGDRDGDDRDDRVSPTRKPDTSPAQVGEDPIADRDDRVSPTRNSDGAGAEAVLSALIALAEAGAADAAMWDEASALASGDDDRDRVTLARARDAVRRGSATPEIAAGVRAVAERAQAADRLDRAWRGHAIAAVLEARSGADGAAAARVAIEIHDRLIAAAAPAWRSAMRGDPERAHAAALVAPPAVAAAAPTVDRDSIVQLRRLLALSRRLNSETSLERLLDEVIDTAIELTAAERGFLLLYQPDSTLHPVVARNFAAADLADADASLSRSIAERAARSGEPVITVDAGIDERFGGAASVAALRLRSVLAVPLRQKGRVTGCLYVDHRLRGGAFDDDAASLLLELGDIAAIAIDNARLGADLRRRTDEVDALNQRLAADLADRDVELARVRAAMPEDRDRLRHPYAGITGRSPAMVSMLKVVDRAAESALPVVIVGESGTGKELVARALHENGPRRDRAFVAVNCSAVPEPLLESELFGHVRGAFTGADRDRRGLFEVADGGTLFLDEVADTGPAMQAKLLRVLQDGVLRRVGDHKTRQVDVRVIAATQRSLAELSAAGKFREDLRYRLDVLTVHVPPLRDRDADLPLLVADLLAELCGDRPRPRMTRAAERALAAHRWPGNVRELENALARAVALSGDVIDVDDLPEAVIASTTTPAAPRTSPDGDLRLKPAIEATERAYLAAALDRSNGNQTVAARLLGLSRFGLQKKLKRLAEGGASADDE